MTPSRVGVAALALAAVFIGGSAGSAAPPPRTCRPPASITPAPELVPPANEIVRDAPTAFYMLALTWAPEACRARGDDPAFAVQCRGDRFGFILHGLWPNGAEGRHPRYCGPAPALRPATVRRHLCMTPSAVLLQHEWAAHGTCGWATPEAYFADAARLWRRLRLPPMAATTTAGQIRDAFAAANRGLPRSGVYIKVVSGRLEDVRLCYDLKYRPAACRGGLGAPDDAVVRVTPRRPR